MTTVPWDAPRTPGTTLRVAAAMIAQDSDAWLCLHDSPEDCDQATATDCSARVTSEEIAAELEALAELPHAVTFRRDGVHVTHPLDCRPGLAACVLWQRAQSLAGPPVDVLLGTPYPARLDGDALVIGALGHERVVAPAEAVSR